MPYDVFISYRQDDTADLVDRLEADLRDRTRFTIFRDASTLAPGELFAEVVSREIAASRVALVLVGPRWLTPRLEQPHDLVRIEIEAALSSSTPIIPVLAQGASMPPRASLPNSLQPLVDRHAAQLRRGHDYKADLARLRAAVQRHVPPRSWLWRAMRMPIPTQISLPAPLTPSEPSPDVGALLASGAIDAAALMPYLQDVFDLLEVEVRTQLEHIEAAVVEAEGDREALEGLKIELEEWQQTLPVFTDWSSEIEQTIDAIDSALELAEEEEDEVDEEEDDNDDDE